MKCESKRIVGYWHYGVILTYAATILGIVGIMMSAMGKHGIAVICLMFSGLFDAFDGLVAKTRKNRSDGDKAFGIQIDSLSDLIAFGVAPVFIGFSMGMDEWYYMIVFVIYTLCALVRLGYFNVSEMVRQTEETGRRSAYEGMPVTQISLILPIFYYIATMFTNSIVTEMIMLTLYVVYAVLMVVRFRLPKPRVKGLVIMIIIFLSTITAMFLIRWFVCGVHSV